MVRLCYVRVLHRVYDRRARRREADEQGTCECSQARQDGTGHTRSVTHPASRRYMCRSIHVGTPEHAARCCRARTATRARARARRRWPRNAGRRGEARRSACSMIDQCVAEDGEPAPTAGRTRLVLAGEHDRLIQGAKNIHASAPFEDDGDTPCGFDHGTGTDVETGARGNRDVSRQGDAGLRWPDRRSRQRGRRMRRSDDTTPRVRHDHGTGEKLSARGRARIATAGTRFRLQVLVLRSRFRSR